MALQIKDRRAVSEKQLKDCLNPEGNFGGEGKRWRRRWWMNKAMHRSNKTASPQGVALDATGDLSFVTRRRDVIVRSSARGRQPAAKGVGARMVCLNSLKRRDRRSDLPEELRRFRVANRPATGVITCRPDEPYVNSTSTVQ